MAKLTAAGIVAGFVLFTASLMAQAYPAQGAGAPPARGVPSNGTGTTVLWPPQGMVPITDRLANQTLHGTIVEISCFRKMGAGTISTPEQVACAKAAVAAKAGVVGILTEGDGIFKLVGAQTVNNYAKFVPLLGKKVDMPGAEVVLSNNFDYHAFEAKGFTPAK